MTTEPRLFNLGNIERFLFRPLFVFFTFVLVLLAIFQATGRFSMQVIHLFEGRVNAMLENQDIVVQGLRGDWRGMNPVIFLNAVNFPAGSVSDVELELDVLESVLRSTPIPQLVRVSDALIHAEQTPSGWRLRGMTAQNIDVTEALRHGDELSGHVQLHLMGLSGHTALLVADLALFNRGGQHYGSVDLANAAYPESQLGVRLWQQEKVTFVRDEANSGRIAGALVLPEIFTGMHGLTINLSDTLWRDEDGQGAGGLSLLLSGVRPTAGQKPLSVRVSLAAQRRQHQLQVMSSQFEIAVADDRLALGPVYANVQLPDAQPSQLTAAAELLAPVESRPQLSVWTEQLNLDEISTFFVRHLGDWEPAASWVRTLAAQGEANNLHAYYDPALGAGFLASVSSLQLQGYKGVPTMTNVQGRLWGYNGGVAMQVNASDVAMGFPRLYEQGWALDTVQGVLKAWFGDGYFGIRGSHLRARLDNSNIGGSFAITRPQERYDQRLTLLMNVDQVNLERARSFVPGNIPPGLANWLERGPREGTLADVQLAMHGQIRLRPGERGRRIELKSKISNGRVEYHPDWPEVSELVGDIHVAGVDTRLNVDSARSKDLRLEGANIVVRNNASFVTGTIDTTSDVGAALDFVRTSPLADTLGFVTPEWQGSGGLKLGGKLVIPIKVDQAPPLAVDLQFGLDSVNLDMPDYRIAVDDLHGSGTFSLPHYLAGDFTGSLFTKPTKFHAHFDKEWLHFDIGGTATPADVYALLATERQVPIVGQFDFDSVLSLAMSGGVTSLSVQTDLTGLQVNLPGHFAKARAVAVAGELDVQFLPAYQSVSWRYRDVDGWLHYGDGIERGALGVGGPPPAIAEDETAVVISGRMPQLVLGDWVSEQGESSISLPLDWVVQDLAVDQFVIDELVFEELTLNGSQRGEEVQFSFDAPHLRGGVDLPAVGVMAINLDYVRVPDPEADLEKHIGAPVEDPITIEVGQSLPAADVNIAQLVLGDEPFGSWRFQMRPQQNKVLFKKFTADVNGVHILDTETTPFSVEVNGVVIDDNVVIWDLASNTSSFHGKINLDDLAQTLPKWDYAGSLTTDRASISADVSWPGSPLNVSLLETEGYVDFAARDGRFIEVDSASGGLRILSLLNFTKVAKRINFDISDVVGKGISFDKIDANIRLARGQLTFPKRLIVDSSSGNYEVGGQVDLRSGQLSIEMIVTLPVSKSLPWYGVYLALANPLAGLGVIVGERVLRKPLEQFSTAKFEVTGTLDDPEVNFVGLLDRSMKEPIIDDVEHKH